MSDEDEEKKKKKAEEEKAKKQAKDEEKKKKLTEMGRRFTKGCVEFLFFVLKSGFFIIIFFFLIFIILGLKESSRKDELDGVCYESNEFGKDVAFNLDVGKIKGVGKGQAKNGIGEVEWIDTGIEATGGYLELFVTGEWYPAGKANTREAKTVVDHLIGTSSVEGDGYMKCDLSDDLSTDGDACSYGIDKETGDCKYLETHEEEYQPLKRYLKFSDSGGVARTYEQNSYINGYHVYDKNTMLRKTNAIDYNSIYAYNQEEENGQSQINCALPNGYGVYIKFGSDANMGYHIANKRIARQVLSADRRTFQNASDAKGKRILDMYPFTLPTTMNDPGVLLTDKAKAYNAISTSNFTNVIERSGAAWKDVEFYGSCATGSLSSSSAATANFSNTLECEFGYPRPKQRIYATVSSNSYGYQDGIVRLKFKRGAQFANDEQFYVMKSVWGAIMENIFGIDIYNGKFSDSGMIITFRNALLSSVAFQAVGYLMLCFSVMYVGYQLFTGSAAVSLKLVLDKMILIGFGVWLLDPQSHVVFDQFLTPLFLKSVDQLVSVIMNGIMSNIGMGSSVVNIDNPFLSFDQIVSDIFGDVVVAKLLGMFRYGGIFAFTPIIVLWTLVAVSMEIIKSASIYMLSNITLAIHLMLLPVAALGLMFSEKYREYFDGIIKQLATKTITSGAGLIGFAIFISLLLGNLVKLFNFKVCFGLDPSWGWIRIYSWMVDGGIDGNNFMYNLAIMIMIIYMSKSLKAYISSMFTAIFGKEDDSFGKKAFNQTFDSTIGAASSAAGGVTKKYLGVNVAVSSKDLDDPTQLASRVTSSTWKGVSSGVDKLEKKALKSLDDKFKKQDEEKRIADNEKKKGEEEKKKAIADPKNKSEEDEIKKGGGGNDDEEEKTETDGASRSVVEEMSGESKGGSNDGKDKKQDEGKGEIDSDGESDGENNIARDGVRDSEGGDGEAKEGVDGDFEVDIGDGSGEKEGDEGGDGVNNFEDGDDEGNDDIPSEGNANNAKQGGSISGGGISSAANGKKSSSNGAASAGEGGVSDAMIDRLEGGVSRNAAVSGLAISSLNQARAISEGSSAHERGISGMQIESVNGVKVEGVVYAEDYAGVVSDRINEIRSMDPEERRNHFTQSELEKISPEFAMDYNTESKVIADEAKDLAAAGNFGQGADTNLGSSSDQAVVGQAQAGAIGETAEGVNAGPGAAPAIDNGEDERNKKIAELEKQKTKEEDKKRVAEEEKEKQELLMKNKSMEEANKALEEFIKEQLENQKALKIAEGDERERLTNEIKKAAEKLNEEFGIKIKDVRDATGEAQANITVNTIQDMQRTGKVMKSAAKIGKIDKEIEKLGGKKKV